MRCRPIVDLGGKLEVHMETITKFAVSSLTALLLIGLLEVNSNAVEPSSGAMASKGLLLKQEYMADSYCHQKLPAIRESSLAGDHPLLSSEETIDFYGRCKQDPVGNDQLNAQRLENSDRKSK